MGFMNMANKGALYSLLKVNDTSLALINCHLPAGESKENYQ